MKLLKKIFKNSNEHSWTKSRHQNWNYAKEKSDGYDNSQSLSPKMYNKQNQLISYPVIANLIKIAAEKNDHLTVLDFGGGTGGTYQDIKNFYPKIKFEWDVVEQEIVVESSQSLIRGELSIMVKIPTNKKYDVVIASGVLQYLDDYRPYLNNLLALDAEYIIIDRTLVFSNSKNKQPILTIQKNSYCSYPCWILNENFIFSRIEEDYLLINKFFSSLDRVNKAAGVRVLCAGGIFKKK